MDSMDSRKEKRSKRKTASRAAARRLALPTGVTNANNFIIKEKSHFQIDKRDGQEVLETVNYAARRPRDLKMKSYYEDRDILLINDMNKI